MPNITLSDMAYKSAVDLAAQNGQTIQEVVESLIAQQATWEEHAIAADDQFLAHGAHGKVMNEEAFFKYLDSLVAERDDDANV